MKKRILVLIMAVVAAASALALSACGATLNSSGTATYGEIGVENHSFFAYSTVTVDSKGAATEVEIGEAFGPTGKLIVTNGSPAYSSPWYPGISKISAAVTDAVNDTLAKKQAVVADKYYICIDGKVFKLVVSNVAFGNIRYRNEEGVLVFVAKDDNSLMLTDRYLADNIKWYVDAIKADKVFICDAAGTKLAADADITLPDDSTVKAAFADGALLKNSADSTYNSSMGLNGAYFKQAMDELATFAKDKNFAVEYEKAEGGNWEGLRVKGFTFTGHPEDAEGITRPTDKETFLNYSASYMKIAEKAFRMARAELF